jgi:hypothetical protein
MYANTGYSAAFNHVLLGEVSRGMIEIGYFVMCFALYIQCATRQNLRRHAGAWLAHMVSKHTYPNPPERIFWASSVAAQDSYGIPDSRMLNFRINQKIPVVMLGSCCVQYISWALQEYGFT